MMIENLKKRFKDIYKHDAKYIFCAPGRSEISGNHTDHQHGLVLATSINLKTYAAINLNDTNTINVSSNGYDSFSIDLNDLEIKENEKGTSASLVRGLCYKFKTLDNDIKGFDAYIDSNILKGGGLSSSASFEILFAYIINYLFLDNKYSKKDLAIFSQFAENIYFDKPSGLMDQMACAMGGIIFIDFKDIKNPEYEEINYHFKDSGYDLIIIDSGAGHENLTDLYASIPNDLKKISNYFNKDYLREVDEKEFYDNISKLRNEFDDGMILRAIHIFEENKRVLKQKQALINNDFETFLNYVKESGNSSYKYLNNVLIKDSSKQYLALSLALAESLLDNKGVTRVHGGGFAGSIQVFIKKEYTNEFVSKMNKLLNNEACHIIDVDEDGVKLLEVIYD